MRKILLPLVAAAALAIPSVATAQRGGILVIDVSRILAECTACRAASTTLQGQANQLRTRAQTLDSQLKPEADAINKAVQALGGKQPDSALQQRAQAFQTRQQQAQTELATSQRRLESTQAHVQQQIGARVVQIAEQVRARRQATAVLSRDSLMAVENSADITGEVLTALNQQLPSVSVTPLPQQQQSQPSGR
jgi:outer membrane protein